MSASPLSLKVSRSLYKGLLSFYNFESSGSLGIDSFGANTLTTSGATSAAGLIGLGLHCARASSQNLFQASGSVGNLSFPGDASFTLAAWVKHDSLTGQQDLIDHSNTVTSNGQYKLIKASGGNFLFQTSANGTSFTSPNSGVLPVTGTWYCVMGWRDASLGKTFVQVNNGAIVSAVAGALFAATASFELGGNRVAGTMLDGTLDLVGVWNRALTGYERTLYYALGAGLQLPFR